MVAYKLVDAVDIVAVKMRTVGRVFFGSGSLMDQRLDVGAVFGNWHLTFGINKNDFIVRRFLIALNEDAVALLQRVRDRLLFEFVVRDDGEVARIVDGDDPGACMKATMGVLAFLVHAEAMGVVLVITDPRLVSVEALNQFLKQGGFPHS